MKRYIQLLCIFLFMVVPSLRAQLKFAGACPGYWTPNPNAFVDVQSPTAASLGKYGDVDVSYFTGNPNISIPLYNLDVRDVSMPISLDYDATGVMPNSLPSWAGQNWTLNVGGIIVRTVKGRYDEWHYPDDPEYHFAHGAYNYFQYHDKLKEYLKEGNGYKNLKTNSMYHTYDVAPDEFTFHFMGKTGKFFLDQDGSWRVESKDNLEVIFDYNKQSNFIDPLVNKYPYSAATDPTPCKTIAGFIIRDDNGNEYTFGYDKNAIEYTTNLWHMSENEKNECWHASSWYLTKVTDRHGNLLYSLHYERGHYIIQFFNTYYADYVREKATGILGASYNYPLTNRFFPYTASISAPVYLTGVDAMNGVSVEISSRDVKDDLATEKIYNSLYVTYNGIQNLYSTMAQMLDRWRMPQFGNTSGAFYYLQAKNKPFSVYQYPSDNDMDILSKARIRMLDYVIIKFKKTSSSDVIGYRLCFSSQNRRLKLDSLLIQDKAVYYCSSVGVKGVYRFKYNNFEQLPPDYLTTCVDHWGYYNGKAYKKDNSHYESNLEICRNPDFRYTPIGVLNEITYPTGGTTVFEYEPNDFSKRLSKDRQQILDSTGIGGGLRIKSIKSYDSSDKKILLREKDYSYTLPNSSKSSGELFAAPLYYWKDWELKCEQSNASYHMSTFHTSSIVPLANSTGVSLGYSYVTEMVRDLTNKDKNLEKHVYHYSNISDPSVRDQKFLLTFGYSNQFTPYDEWSELGFKKGLLLDVTTYNGDGKKTGTIGFKYRADNYLNDYVLTSNLNYECSGNSAQYAHYLGGIYKLYYPKYDIVEQQDTIYNPVGKDKMVTIHSYEKSDIKYTSWLPYKHQINARIINSETKKRGAVYETNSYKFGDFNAKSGNDSILYKSHFFIKPYVTSFSRNGKLISEEKTQYSGYNVNGKSSLLPKMVTSRNSDNVTDTLVSYQSYTSTGMPSQFKKKGKPYTFLKWCINDSYLVMAGNNYIPFSVPESLFLDQKSFLSDLKAWFHGYVGGQITGYVWEPLFGLAAVVEPNGNVRSYGYDQFGRLSNIRDYNNVLLKEYQYNYRK